MKKEFLPFYLSRAILGLVFGFLVMGISGKAILFGIAFFGFCLLYLHSGWFSVDLRYPLTPLRRDAHGQDVQRKALITAIVVGSIIYLASSLLSGLVYLPANTAFLSGIAVYFVTQFGLFIYTRFSA